MPESSSSSSKRSVKGERELEQESEKPRAGEKADVQIFTIICPSPCPPVWCLLRLSEIRSEGRRELCWTLSISLRQHLQARQAFVLLSVSSQLMSICGRSFTIGCAAATAAGMGVQRTTALIIRKATGREGTGRGKDSIKKQRQHLILSPRAVQFCYFSCSRYRMNRAKVTACYVYVWHFCDYEEVTSNGISCKFHSETSMRAKRVHYGISTSTSLLKSFAD